METNDSGELVKRPFTTVKNYDPKVKAEAYDMFLNTDMDLTDIAIKVGVSKSVIAAWSRDGGWAKHKEDLELELFRSAESKFRNFFLEYKLPTLIRHIETAKMLEEQIAAILKKAQDKNKTLDATELRRLSESLASVTNVSARAVGIGDKGALERVAPKQDPYGGKRPLVAIGIAPTLASGVDIKVVEGTCEEVTDEPTKPRVTVSETPAVGDRNPQVSGAGGASLPELEGNTPGDSEGRTGQ